MNFFGCYTGATTILYHNCQAEAYYLSTPKISFSCFTFKSLPNRRVSFGLFLHIFLFVEKSLNYSNNVITIGLPDKKEILLYIH